jgi:hypothetical protein
LQRAVTSAEVPFRANVVVALPCVGAHLASGVVTRLQEAGEALARLAYAAGRVGAHHSDVAMDAARHVVEDPPRIGSVPHLASALAAVVGSVLVSTGLEGRPSRFGRGPRAGCRCLCPLLAVVSVGADGRLLSGWAVVPFKRLHQGWKL